MAVTHGRGLVAYNRHGVGGGVEGHAYSAELKFWLFNNHLWNVQCGHSPRKFIIFLIQMVFRGRNRGLERT